MGTNSLGSVANWMNEVRGTPEGIVKPWHFQSADACDGELLKCQGDQCAGPQIEAQIKALRSGNGDQLKALRVLVHLIGDIHQPLHTAENRDVGGNSVTISNRYCVDCKGDVVRCNLHTYWETAWSREP